MQVTGIHYDEIGRRKSCGIVSTVRLNKRYANVAMSCYCLIEIAMICGLRQVWRRGVLFGGGVIAIAGRHFSRGGQHFFCMYLLRDGVRIAAREQIVVRHDGKAKMAAQGKAIVHEQDPVITVSNIGGSP